MQSWLDRQCRKMRAKRVRVSLFVVRDENLGLLYELSRSSTMTSMELVGDERISTELTPERVDSFLSIAGLRGCTRCARVLAKGLMRGLWTRGRQASTCCCVYCCSRGKPMTSKAVEIRRTDDVCCGMSVEHQRSSKRR